MKYDAVIIGAGPIGSNVALHLSKKGFEVAVVEQKREIGIPLKCAGLVSKRVIELSGISPNKIIQNELYGAYIHSPEGRVFEIESDRVQAFAIDRVLFDKLLAENAQNYNAVYLLNNKAYSFGDGKVQIKSDGESGVLQYKILIGADGAKSKVREFFGFPDPKEVLLGVGAEVENININPKKVHIFFSRNIAPGFFAWIIPTNREGTEARIGLCTSTPPPKPIKSYFDMMFTNPLTEPFLKGCTVKGLLGGAIPLGFLDETAMDRVMIVGDAASQVKPLSGGGLYPGLLSSNFCSEVAEEALENNDASKKILKKYHNLWSAALKREIAIGMRIRKRFLQMDDSQVDKYLSYLNDEEILSIISKYGDIDYPSKLAFPLLKNIPILLKFLPEIMHL